MRFLRILIIWGFLAILPSVSRAQFEHVRDSIVQIYGVVMMGDSMRVVSDVNVWVKGTNRGTRTNAQGVFSIVAEKGDILEFTHASFKAREALIPKDIPSNMYSMVEVLGYDTLSLPEIIIKPRPSKEEFERDFIAFRDVSALNEIAMGNASPLSLADLTHYTMSDDKTATINKTLTNQNHPYNTGGINLFNVFNPSSWKSIANGWKKKNNPK